jgi:Ca2+-binding RTX toxin-like protein
MRVTPADLYAILLEVKVYEEHNSAIWQFTAAQGRAPTTAESAELLKALNGGLPMEPIGIRTTSGIYNNLPPGNPDFNTSDQAFPRFVPASYTQGDAGNGFDLNGPAPGGLINNADYTPGASVGNNVVDIQPRLISNLIADQTTANPAAVQAALRAGGGPALWEGSTDINGNRITDVQAALSAGLLSETTLVNGQTVLRSQEGQLLNSEGQLVDEAGYVVLSIPSQSADGLSAPFNSWFTLFGQGFDHGLDHLAKGNNGTVFIPLLPGDPLYNPATPQTNFMVVTRAATGETNTITPLVDMNQAYGSHPSFQVFLREYVLEGGRVVNTGELLKGANGGLPTWADIKQQARTVLGIDLTDAFVGNSPLLATDDYGNFLPGVTGLPQVVIGESLVEGNLLAPIDISAATRTGHAFLLDIAHSADPGINKAADGDSALGLADLGGNAILPDPNNGQTPFYDNELLDRHFIAGDGRVNENYGLTAFHLNFHNEHDRLINDYKNTLLAAGDAVALAEWLRPSNEAALLADPTVVRIDDVVAAQALIDAYILDNTNLGNPAQWDGLRLFQAGRFMTEMQYQHGVFEEFARSIQPNINLFGGVTITIDANIKAEFAHAVYRFGHSLLQENVSSFTPDWQNTTDGLIQAFLNPVGFTEGGLSQEQAAAAVLRGMTRQQANAADEFVTGSLRNNLVGLPLDLAATNIARARELGIPSLQAVRQDFFSKTGDISLAPYASWAHFGAGIRHPESIINFMAAYGTHTSITSAESLTDKRAAAYAIVTGVDAPADADAFLNGSGDYAADLGGLNDVDLWIGGLAEKPMDQVNHLGSTFAFVFENTLEALQNSDRFYYLGRLSGNLLEQIESNTFAAMLQRNLGDKEGTLLHLPGLSFTRADFTLEVNQAVQFNAGLGGQDPTGAGLVQLVNREASSVAANALRFNGGEHVVIAGTDQSDLLAGGDGDDTFYGEGGADIIITGQGDDQVFAGVGNDIIYDSGNVAGDVIRGEDGDDIVVATTGAALIFGGTGADMIYGGRGSDLTEIFGGEGGDFIRASDGGGAITGGVGDDWIEGDIGADLIVADSDRLLVNPTTGLLEPSGQEVGDDVIFGGENDNQADGGLGDDIYINGPSHDAFSGGGGFDIFSAAQDLGPLTVDLNEIPPLTPPPIEPLDSFDAAVEAAVGSEFNDTIIGDHRDRIGLVFDAQTGAVINNLDNSLSSTSKVSGLMSTGANGFQQLIPTVALSADGTFNSGNVLLGGGGDDEMQGNGGTDVLDGDATLQVQLEWQGNRFASMDALQLAALNQIVNPADITIVRELVRPESNLASPGTGDVAVFRGAPGEYRIEGLVWNGSAFEADVDGETADLTSQDGFLAVQHTVVASDVNNGTAAPDQTVFDQFGNAVIAQFADGTDYLRNIEGLRFLHNGEVQGQIVDGLFVADLDQFGNTIPIVTEIDLRGLTTAGAVPLDGQQDPLEIQPLTTPLAQVDVAPIDQIVTQAIQQQSTTTAQTAAFAATVDFSGFAPQVQPVPPAPPTTPPTTPAPSPSSGSAASSALQEPVPPSAPVVRQFPVDQLGTTVEASGALRTFLADNGRYGVHPIGQSDQAVELQMPGKLRKFRVLSAEQSRSGFNAVLKKGKQYLHATFDHDGDLLKTRSLKSKQLQRFERRLQHDFDGDQLIGGRSAARDASQLLQGDVVIGSGGRRMFALANQAGDLYASAGDQDVLVIQDFRSGADGDVLIASAASQYSLGQYGDSAGIFKGSPANGELVALLQGVAPQVGTHINFSFV